MRRRQERPENYRVQCSDKGNDQRKSGREGGWRGVIRKEG